MTRKQNSFFRDLTFHVNRRNFGRNIPSTDIDFLEYDNFQPVDIREFKNKNSNWRSGERTASIKATFNLAKMANIPFYIIEHNDDFSSISICQIKKWNRNVPVVFNEQNMTLPEYVKSLYKARNRTFPDSVYVPNTLTQINIPHIICHLFEELEQDDRVELLNMLNKFYLNSE